MALGPTRSEDDLKMTQYNHQPSTAPDRSHPGTRLPRLHIEGDLPKGIMEFKGPNMKVNVGLAR